MSELLVVQKILDEKGLGYVVPRALNPMSAVLVLEVPRARLGEAASKDKTSRRQLVYVSKVIEQRLGKRVIVTLRDSQSLDDIAVSLRAVLRRDFPDLVADVHVSFLTSKSAVVWVESKVVVDSKGIETLQATVKNELAKFELACQAFDVVSPQMPEASIAAILRTLKVHAPASLATLRQELLRRGLSCPSEKWLSYKLDFSRKRGLVLREQDGRFLLTAAGLDVVPWGRTGSSSDVDRMLSLARRKHW